MALRGNLKELSLPDIFQLVTFSGKTGVLRIHRGDGGQGSVWFRDGDVFFAQSNWHNDPLGERLVRAQRITPMALDRALELRSEQPEAGKRLGEILVEQGYITDKVLEAFVQEQMQDTIFDLMRWDEGDFEFESMPEAPEEDIGLAVSIENVIMEGSRRLEEWNRIKKKIPSTDVVFKMATAPGEGTFEISLKPTEWNLLLLIDGSRSIAELAEATNRTDFEVARIVYGLFSAGLLEFATEDETESARAERAEREAKYAAFEAEQTVRRAAQEATKPKPAPEPMPDAAPGNEAEPQPEQGVEALMVGEAGPGAVALSAPVEVPEFLDAESHASTADFSALEAAMDALLSAPPAAAPAPIAPPAAPYSPGEEPAFIAASQESEGTAQGMAVPSVEDLLPDITDLVPAPVAQSEEPAVEPEPEAALEPAAEEAAMPGSAPATQAAPGLDAMPTPELPIGPESASEPTTQPEPVAESAVEPPIDAEPPATPAIMTAQEPELQAQPEPQLPGESELESPTALAPEEVTEFARETVPALEAEAATELATDISTEPAPEAAPAALWSPPALGEGKPTVEAEVLAPTETLPEPEDASEPTREQTAGPAPKPVPEQELPMPVPTPVADFEFIQVTAPGQPGAETDQPPSSFSTSPLEPGSFVVVPVTIPEGGTEPEAPPAFDWEAPSSEFVDEPAAQQPAAATTFFDLPMVPVTAPASDTDHVSALLPDAPVAVEPLAAQVPQVLLSAASTPPAELSPEPSAPAPEHVPAEQPAASTIPGLMNFESDLMALGLGELPAELREPRGSDEPMDLDPVVEPMGVGADRPPAPTPADDVKASEAQSAFEAGTVQPASAPIYSAGRVGGAVEPDPEHDQNVDFSALLKSLDISADDAEAADSPAASTEPEPSLQQSRTPGPQPQAAPHDMPVASAGVISTEPFLDNLTIESDFAFSGELSDELSALTGADRPSRPAVNVHKIPEAGESVIRRDVRVDRQTLLKIIQGIESL